MGDYFDTLSPEEVAENIKVWNDIQKNKSKNKQNNNNNNIQNDNIPTNDNIQKCNIPTNDIKNNDILTNNNDIQNYIVPNYLDKIPDNIYGILFKRGYEQLNHFQQSVFHECCVKKSAALSLPLGSGKTIISLVIALYLNMISEGKIIIVVSKSLITNWEIEIKKFFADALPYKVIHHDHVKDINKWKMNVQDIIILTTIDVISTYYKENDIDKMFIENRFVLHARHLGAYINFYRIPDNPYLTHTIGGGQFYSIKWGTLIIDEIQTYTNITTQRCQALGALFVQYRWALSGTLFDQPVIERILGYHIIMNISNMPRNLPDTKTLIKSNEFKGLNEHVIHRKDNLAFIAPKMNDQIITHHLSIDEEKIYTMMKNILIAMKNKAQQAKLNGDKDLQKLFNSYKLVMIMYLRQSLICPLIPITSVVIESSNMEKKSQIATIIMKELKQLHIDDYLNDQKSVLSTRLKSVMKVIDKHDEKCIIFSCFVSCLDILEYFIKKETTRPVFCLTSDLSSNKRGELINNFEASKNGLFLSTYDLCSQGLNLQFAAIVLLIDYWWHAGKTQQAIGRIFRYGQLAETVNVYFFSANTGIEKIIYEKQNAKLMILNELKTGKQTMEIPKIKMDEIIRLIELDNNKVLLTKVQKHIY
jgi:SNF2 family DNA or RNA helicase